MSSAGDLRPTARVAAGVGVACVSIVLIALGVAKFVSLEEFARIVASHGAVPEADAPALARFVALAELGVGAVSLFLLLARRSPASALIVGAFMSAATGYALWLTIDPPPTPAPCGCWFDLEPTDPGARWTVVMIRNATLAGGSALAAWVLCTRPRGDRAHAGD